MPAQHQLYWLDIRWQVCRHLSQHFISFWQYLSQMHNQLQDLHQSDELYFVPEWILPPEGTSCLCLSLQSLAVFPRISLHGLSSQLCLLPVRKLDGPMYEMSAWTAILQSYLCGYVSYKHCHFCKWGVSAMCPTLPDMLQSLLIGLSELY